MNYIACDEIEAETEIDMPRGERSFTATFGIEAYEFELEPYSYGGSRGYDLDVTARLRSLRMTREELADIIGEKTVADMEASAAEEYRRQKLDEMRGI